MARVLLSSSLVIPVLNCVYLVGYLVLIPYIDWLELRTPRGGIIGFFLYLLMASGLVWAGKTWSWLEHGVRLQLRMGGWLLLMMPPTWPLIHFFLVN